MLKLSLSPFEGGELNWPGIPEWMARLLFARGVQSAREAQAFLHPDSSQLRPPLALPGMERAAAILRRAAAEGRKIAIYGDYDADGVCAAVILRDALEGLGADTRVYIPDRHEEGYGLNTPAVLRLAEDCRVLVTVDCGITSLEEVRAAREKGMEVIITDHHRPGAVLPEADAIVSPLMEGYPFPFLCGAGVAWKTAMALLGEDAGALMELAALATVADLVPLTGENRALVALGLRQLADTRRPGLRALMEAAGIRGGITSQQVAFQLAPRINACGRMESAAIALELLSTRDQARAQTLALKMDRLNQERKNQEQQVVEQAVSQAEEMDLVSLRAIVVCGEGWNSGVVGLAAGKIAEKYACPTVALSLEGDTCVGSARSAGDVDIYAALSECADLFLRFGGHKQAAGLTMPAENLPALRERLSRAVARQTGDMPCIPEIICEGELSLAQVTEETIELLSMLEPCGMGNPEPRFLCRDAEALSLRAVGAQGRHLKCTFRQGNDLRDGIFFGGGEWAGASVGLFQMAFTPEINEFRGKISAECRVHALQMEPETLPYDLRREGAALLAEERGEASAAPLTPAGLDALMAGGQGTLLVCRCLETALALRARYPQADFALESARDPRAFHTVFLYGRAAGACAGFRHVVLCDGDLGEGAGYRAACPEADIFALPETAALRRLLSALFVPREVLRACYVRLRCALPRDLEDFSAQSGLPPPQAAFALTVLSEMGLIAYSPSPFSISILPMLRRDPSENKLFCLAQQAREDMNGLHSL